MAALLTSRQSEPGSFALLLMALIFSYLLSRGCTPGIPFGVLVFLDTLLESLNLGSELGIIADTFPGDGFPSLCWWVVAWS